MLNESLKGIFTGEFTEVTLTCIESSLPKNSTVTVVDVRNNPKYNGVECVVLLGSEELREEVSKNIARGYHNVSKKANRNDLKSLVLPILSSDYEEYDEDIKYTLNV